MTWRDWPGGGDDVVAVGGLNLLRMTAWVWKEDGNAAVYY